MSSKPIVILLHIQDTANRSKALCLAIAILIASFLAIAFMPDLAPPAFEGRDYLAIAQLDYSRVNTYYGGRVLHPLTVRLIAKTMYGEIDGSAFRWASIISLLAIFSLLAVYYYSELAGSWPWTLLLATPIVLDQYRSYYWPELFYAALCAGFLLVLSRNRWASLPILFLLYLTRESTIVLVAILIVVAMLYRLRSFAVAVFLVGIGGITANSRLVAVSRPNRHGIPMFVLDALKIPFNFALNILGLTFWVNTNADSTPAPIWKVDLPAWIHLGGMRQAGFSGFQPMQPVALLLLILTSFGIMPLVVIAGMRRWKGARFEQSVALAYGGAMLVLTPLVGTTPGRYILAAWPLFWMAAVWMLGGDIQLRTRLILISLAVSWIPALVHFAAKRPSYQGSSLSELTLTLSLVAIGIALLIYAGTWQSVKGSVGANRF